VTGKARPGDYRENNIEGTRRLVEACSAAGIRQLLYVSSIAAGYEDKRFYSYAKSKAAAEEIVAGSGLSHAILRPTVILGLGSPLGETLRKIASPSTIPLPQASRPVFVQPVHVEDVAKAIVAL
jgi:nucleoside-diphosphate-sugar epimerase